MPDSLAFASQRPAVERGAGARRSTHQLFQDTPAPPFARSCRDVESTGASLAKVKKGHRMTPDYTHITKPLDTITPISADMCGLK